MFADKSKELGPAGMELFLDVGEEFRLGERAEPRTGEFPTTSPGASGILRWYGGVGVVESVVKDADGDSVLTGAVAAFEGGKGDIEICELSSCGCEVESRFEVGNMFSCIDGINAECGIVVAADGFTWE